MTTGDEEYQLGRDVTHLAKANDNRGTAVISVRLGATDIARLEGIGRESGKTVSQVVRDAIAAYRVKRPALIVGFWSGSTVTLGEPEEFSGTVGWDVSYSDPEPNPTGTTVPIQQ